MSAPRGALGWADVVRTWVAADEVGVPVETLASALGFQADPLAAVSTPPPAGSDPALSRRPEQTPQPEPEARSGAAMVPMFRPPAAFWRCVGFEPGEGDAGSDDRGRPGEVGAVGEVKVSVARVSLSVAPKATVLAQLQGGLAVDRRTRTIHVERLARREARGFSPWPPPVRTLRRWPRRLTLWLDRSPAMAPVWDDAIELHLWLHEYLQEGLQTELLSEGAPRPPEPDDGEPSPWRALTGTHHLFVTDLGWGGSQEARLRWGALGYFLRSQGVEAWALTPSPLPGRASKLGFRTLAWTPPSRPPSPAEAERLRNLGALFPALTTSVMRRLRRHPVFGFGAGLDAEAILRSTPGATVNTHGVSFEGADLRERRSALIQAKLTRVELEGLGAILASLPRADLARDPGSWVESVVCVDGLAGPEQRDVLPAWVRAEAAKLLSESRDHAVHREDLRAWRVRFAEQTGGLDPTRLSAELRDGVLAARRDAGLGSPAGGFPPPFDRPVVLESDAEGRLRLVSEPTARGAALTELPRTPSLDVSGAHAGALSLDGPALRFTAAEAAKQARIAQLRAENPWADDVGEDVFGPWARVVARGRSADEVSFVLRYVPPGTFWMGSPEDEEGRYGDEGPRHQVTLTEGYWMAETPCTQVLWEAVMGENPSRFKGPKRPVETVSWNEVETFVNRLNAAKPGLNLKLPTEAQWERACRAGTHGTRYGGPLDALAWFGENSERSNGERGTHDVGLKAPNGLGLYDTLGHVWEWCADVWTDDYGSPDRRTDPTRTRGGTKRVYRGGSWFGPARSCRAAFRGGNDPGNRYDFLGFRVSRGQAAEPRPDGDGVPARAEERTAPPPGGDRPERLKNALRLESSNGARHAFEPLVRPAWAHEVGRDRFGLYAEVRPGGFAPEAWLRLRWISPGTFMMGSPEEEPGRFSWEGPRHPVTLTQGFWLADAPCTQALWQSVMGENPSRFKNPGRPALSFGRPVEQVSWEDVQVFLQRLSKHLPGASLPTEAQWEYACRAGTETAIYTGPLEIRGEHDAPGLDPVAWYGGNSGQGFELEDGEDSAGWEGKQYPHTTAGTRWVRTRAPNPWGLYDMLGNVWEWCADAWSFGGGYGSPDPRRDPTGTDGGSGRVFRGGSWIAPAGSCRAACRDGYGPGSRHDNLGFRVSRGQAAEPISVWPGDPATEVSSPGRSGAEPSPAEPAVTRASDPRPGFFGRVGRWFRGGSEKD